MRGQRRHILNRNGIPRRELERAIFIPLRTRSSISALNLPASQDSARLNNLIATNLNEDIRRVDSIRNGSNRPRVNVSSFFMELTYSAGEPNGIHILNRNSKEGQKRRLLEIHAANTMNIIKQYCPAKPHKLNQFRCCVRVQRDETFTFRNLMDKPLESLDPTQIKCNIKVLVLIRDDPSGKWNNSFTPYLLNCLFKKHLNPTCITFQSEAFLNTLVEQLNDDLHVFSRSNNANDSSFMAQAKKFIVMSTLAKLAENWSVSLLVLDSCLSRIIDFEEIVEFCKRFEIKLIDVDSNSYTGASKQRRAVAKRIRREIRSALTVCNLRRIGGELKRLQLKLAKNGIEPAKKFSDFSKISPALISEDCKRIVFSLHERMNVALVQHEKELLQGTPRISLLEDGILADIEKTDAFKHSQNLVTSNCDRQSYNCIIQRIFGESEERRPKTSSSKSEDDSMPLLRFNGNKTDFSTALVREREKISELLFNELNQRWRIHGPQRFTPKTGDAGPYCSRVMDSEKQLLFTILQEVTYFETLKDIRNELKDSKKDLEGRLYGYNPDFANLIASAEEFLHGKASCMEPCKDEIQFYKLPVSLVMSDAEVKYLRSKPPTYVVGQESPTHLVRSAIEESTKMFMDAVIRTTCGTRKLSFSRKSKTKVIIVIEDNSEALELITVALWFFDKTPLATFQSKYYYNTSEFLQSLDACRLFFRAYPAHSAKKDEERIFERWLGVGINGILRSFEHKILLIDFPRPGMHLQNSKNILLNRLKMEEKLNNIKSFIIGKPTRKEDNLSTVERLLDEIQSALEPRDKLLFRKSRRMYMDLKLYKQIEQKSRQDLKALRDWGLPEPENEHELWEKLRNSDLIINEPLPSSNGAVILDSIETQSTLHESESVSAINSCCEEDEDISDPESLFANNKSDESKNSGSEDANFLSECEEIMESNLMGEDNVSTKDEVHPFFLTLQMHASRNSTCYGSLTADVYPPPVQNNEKDDMDEVKASKIHHNINDSNAAESITLSRAVSPSMTLHSFELMPNNVTEEYKADSLSSLPTLAASNSQACHQPTEIEISNNATNVLLENKEDCCMQSRRDKKHTMRKYSITDSEIQTEAFTKLEFTLPPDEDDITCSSIFPTIGPIDDALQVKKSETCIEQQFVERHRLSLNLIPKSRSRKTLPDLCLAYMSKCAKSLARTLHKTTARKKFPERLQSESNERDHTLVKETDHGSVAAVIEPLQINSQASEDKHRTAKHPWFLHFLRHLRRADKKRTRAEIDPKK